MEINYPVYVTGITKQLEGIVAFLGPVGFADGDDWVGVRLTGTSVGRGKHDGSVNGHQYFRCDGPKNGLFVRESQVTGRVLNKLEKLRLSRELRRFRDEQQTKYFNHNNNHNKDEATDRSDDPDDPLNVSSNAEEHNNDTDDSTATQRQLQRDAAAAISDIVIQSIFRKIDVHELVTRIQALARGYLLRLRIINEQKNEDDDDDSSSSSSSSSSTSSAAWDYASTTQLGAPIGLDDDEDVVILVQALVRGYLVRLKDKKHGAAVVLQRYVRGWMTRKHLFFDVLYEYIIHVQSKETRAAITIQSMWRRYAAQQMFILNLLQQYMLYQDQQLQEFTIEQKQEKAAIRIQSLARGYITRQYLMEPVLYQYVLRKQQQEEHEEEDEDDSLNNKYRMSLVVV